MESFKTIENNTSYEIVEKRSKFIANIFYVETVDKAEEIIKLTRKKYYDAKHNCYAYITMDNEQNVVEKCSDDGEPSGTAGAPMLTILKMNNFCNVLVIVTRYFGGILLGTGGLVRAYSEVVVGAINEAKFILKEKGKLVKVIIGYEYTESFKYYLRKNKINVIKEEYLDNVEFLIEISNEMLDYLTSNLDNLSFKMTKIDILEDKYIKRNIVV